jgi:hypothetical protein
MRVISQHSFGVPLGSLPNDALFGDNVTPIGNGITAPRYLTKAAAEANGCEIISSLLQSVVALFRFCKRRK